MKLNSIIICFLNLLIFGCGASHPSSQTQSTTATTATTSKVTPKTTPKITPKITPKTTPKPKKEPITERERVATLELINKAGLTIDEVSYLSNLVRQAAGRLPISRYGVITKDNILVMLPQNKQLEDCEVGCAVQTGREIGAHWIVTGEVLKFGGELRVSLSLHHSSSGELRGSGTAKAREVKELEGTLQAEALRLFTAIDPSLKTIAKSVKRDETISTNITSVPQSSNVDHRWLVVGCSHKKDHESSQYLAEKSNSLIKSKGFNHSRVIDSEGLDGFNCCYWSCIIDQYKDRSDGDSAIQKLNDLGIDSYLKKSEDYIHQKTGIVFKVIPAGEFMMGSDKNKDETPSHQVSVSTFYMSKTEVTVQQYDYCVRDGFCSEPREGSNCNWRRPNRDNYPVNCVSWSQARRFAQYLGDKFDLPTEAEWEYAALGNQNYVYSGSNDAHDVAWFLENSSGESHPVGQKSANQFGLFDMSGNIWEWTLDEYRNSYLGAPSHADHIVGKLPVCHSANSCSGTSKRVGRGGSFKYKESLIRVKQRRYSREDKTSDMFGFRVRLKK